MASLALIVVVKTQDGKEVCYAPWYSRTSFSPDQFGTATIGQRIGIAIFPTLGWQPRPASVGGRRHFVSRTPLHTRYDSVDLPVSSFGSDAVVSASRAPFFGLSAGAGTGALFVGNRRLLSGEAALAGRRREAADAGHGTAIAPARNARRLALEGATGQVGRRHDRLHARYAGESTRVSPITQAKARRRLPLGTHGGAVFVGGGHGARGCDRRLSGQGDRRGLLVAHFVRQLRTGRCAAGRPHFLHVFRHRPAARTPGRYGGALASTPPCRFSSRPAPGTRRPLGDLDQTSHATPMDGPRNLSTPPPTGDGARSARAREHPRLSLQEPCRRHDVAGRGAIRSARFGRTVSCPLASRTRSAFVEADVANGCPALPNARDGAQRNLGPFSGLQSDPQSNGRRRRKARHPATRPQLQKRARSVVGVRALPGQHVARPGRNVLCPSARCPRSPPCRRPTGSVRAAR